MNARARSDTAARRRIPEALCRRADRVVCQELHRRGLWWPRRPEEMGVMMPSLFETRRGQAGRNPAARFARLLKRQGFLPTRHFVERFGQRVLARGLRFDPRAFGREFSAARHYRQTRPGYRTRIAVVRGVPVMYRGGGWTGERIVLVGVLPVGARPPVTPIRAPNREALFEAETAAEKYARQKAEYQSCLNAYKPSGGRLPTGPGKAFRRAFRKPRKTFLSCQHLNPDAPRFMRGWYQQEQRRQELARRQRAQSFTAAGQGQTAARQKRWRAVAADPTQSASARQWAADQLRRLAAGQGRQKTLAAGRTLRKPNVRVVPSYNVGHPLGHVRVKGKKVAHKSLQDPRSFRTEMAAQNQGRPAIANRVFAKRRGSSWAYQESDPWL